MVKVKGKPVLPNVHVGILLIVNILLMLLGLVWLWNKYSYILEFVIYRNLLYTTLSLPYSPNKRNLLLYSNSTMHLTGVNLGYGLPSLKKFLEPLKVKTILYIPYAWPNIRDGVDTGAADQSVKGLQSTFSKVGVKVDLLDTSTDSSFQIDRIRNAEAVYMCGGNTFWLTKTLHEKGVIPILRERINGGMPYIGASAGTNVVCPTMQTTNDMPNTCLPSCETLNIIPFQINVHFNDYVCPPGFGGESRTLRICEYLQGNRKFPSGKPTFVLGIKEGSLLHISGDQGEILGLQSRKAKLMQIENGKFTSKNISVGSRIDNLLKG